MNKGSRIALAVTGTIASLVAVALVAGGALALWGDSLKGDDGYLKTDTERFSAGTRALATDNLDVDLGDADFLAQSDDLGGSTETAHRDPEGQVDRAIAVAEPARSDRGTDLRRPDCPASRARIPRGRTRRRPHRCCVRGRCARRTSRRAR